MNPTYAQADVRAQLSILSQPPVAPIDINTNLPPQFWRAGGIQIDIGIFDGSENGLDLSNLTQLQLTLAPSPTSLWPWLTKTVSSSSIVSPIDFGDWQSGLSQNATFVLTPADTDLGLLAQASRQFWMTIVGTTDDGIPIVYGAGWVTIYNPGPIYPPPSGGVVNWGSFASSVAGNIVIQPTALIYTAEGTVTGSAGTRNFILQSAGYPRGAKVDILFLLDGAAAGIVLNLYSNSVGGSPILSFTTDGVQPNALFKVVLNASQGYDALELVVPAFYA